MLIKSLIREYGHQSGLTVVGMKITEWPYDSPQPTPEECAALMAKWEPVIEWEKRMEASDRYLMDRRWEDHIEHCHGGEAGPMQQAVFDQKKALRAGRPVTS
ncbi:MAG: hypothetical protein H7838_11400 [Magnetococcus sp. DMHC-8]